MGIFSVKRAEISHRYLVIWGFILLLIAAPSAVAQDAKSIDTLRQMGKAFAGIAEKASPAVVGLRAKKTVTQDYPAVEEWPFGERFDPFDDDFFDFFFRRRSPRQQRSPRQRSPRQKYHQLSQGSGFIISADGYILTNNHLVGEADEGGVEIQLADGRDFKAKIVGTDPETDIAVIKIDADNLPTVELADSDTLGVGEWVVAIGNPFGLSHTVTAGIVSAKGRSNFRLEGIEYQDFIQTDAAINPGNSGGPLLNLNGKVVGINTAIITGYPAHRGNVGIGFAIPINMAKAIYDQLVEGGTVARGWLGIVIQDLTPELAESFELEESKGVLISEVMEDSAAEKAGIEQGDIVVELEGEPVESKDTFRNSVAMKKPGTKVKITVLRDGKRKNLTAELGQRPSGKQLAADRSDTLEQLGLVVKNLTDDLAERLGYKDVSGVVVTQVEPGSIAEFAGIERGALIMEVNREPVKNVKEFDEAIEQAFEKGTVLLLIKYKRFSRFVALQLPKK